ncbi:MAG: orotate phosphoribosyltransferase [Dehalococcoidia bacterium]
MTEATAGIGLRILEVAKARDALMFGEFKLSSGGTSRYYFDGRLLTLSPEGANLVAQALLPAVRESGADAVGGPTLGADPMVTALAMLSGQDGGRPLPAFIVRKESKGHGMGKMIEGPLKPGSKVAIVDDACSTAASLYHAIEAVESDGHQVVLVASIIDRHQGGSDRLRKDGYAFYAVLEGDADGNVRPVE